MGGRLDLRLCRLLLALLVMSKQRVFYVPGRTVNRMAGAYATEVSVLIVALLRHHPTLMVPRNDRLNIHTGSSASARHRRPEYNSMGALSDAALSAVRIVVSFLFVCHGAQKLFGVFGGVDEQGATAPVGSWPAWWAGLIELVGGGLVLLGLFTTPAALLCSGAMAFAYFTMHQSLGLLPLQNQGELAALYSWIFLLIAVLGPGRFSLDAVLRRLRPSHRRSG